jgi:hypothetical protein
LIITWKPTLQGLVSNPCQVWLTGFRTGLWKKTALAIYQKVLSDQHPETQKVKLTVKVLHIMMLLHCNKQTLLGIIQSLAQQTNLSELNTEVMLAILERLKSNPELLLYLQEALHQNTEASDDNT